MNKTLQDIGLMIAVSVIVALSFILYLQVIGIPTTTARNFYNQALVTANMHERERLLNESLRWWPEDYVRAELKQVQDLLGQE